MLHKTIKRNFTRRRVIVDYIDEIWAADLVEMQQFSKWSKGHRYLLMVADVFSKYGWKHSKASSKKEENQSICGLITERSSTTNI